MGIFKTHLTNDAQWEMDLKKLLFFVMVLTGCTTQSDDNPPVFEETKPERHCAELSSERPDLTITNEKYYGKVFLQATFNYDSDKFEKYIVVRSAIYLKSDSSTFRTYSSDGNMPLPNLYKLIISEISTRVDSSGLLYNLRYDKDCFDNEWLTFPIEIK